MILLRCLLALLALLAMILLRCLLALLSLIAMIQPPAPTPLLPALIPPAPAPSPAPVALIPLLALLALLIRLLLVLLLMLAVLGGVDASASGFSESSGWPMGAASLGIRPTSGLGHVAAFAALWLLDRGTQRPRPDSHSPWLALLLLLQLQHVKRRWRWSGLC